MFTFMVQPRVADSDPHYFEKPDPLKVKS